MTLRSTLLVALFVLATGEARAQAASTTWALSSGTLMGSSSTGNVSGTNQTISGGSPAMTVFDYAAMGQRLYMGTAGWTAGPEDPARFIQFDTAPIGGYSFTITSASFEYGAANRTTGMSSNVWYSTDGWSTRTQLATNLTYPASGMATFSANTNVTVPPGATFSLRIYPRALLTQLAAAPQFSVHNTVRIAGTTALVLTGTGPFCTTFEGGTSGGWTGNNTIVSQDSTEGNQYIQTTDQSGASYFYNTSPEYTGDWRPLFADGCGSLCWDVKFVYPGDVYAGQIPPNTMTPSIALEGGGFTAFFVASSPISIGDDWRRICAPLKGLNPDGTMPSNADGHWVMGVGTPADWATLLSNVSRVRLPTDPTSYQAERFQFDNICIRNTGDCAPPPPPLPGSVCGVKYNDTDGDGVKDPGEVGLPDWAITLAYTGAAGPATLTTTTDINGAYCFANLAGGVTYTVSEVQQSGWMQTAPATPGTYTVPLTAGESVTGRDFGNRQSSAGVCIAPPMGLVGWWSGDNTPEDETAFANDGTLVGGATYAPGMVGTAFSFASTSDYVSVPDAPALDFGTGDFTIDAWIRTTAPNGIIVSKTDGSATNPIGYHFYTSSGGISLGIGDGVQTNTVVGIGPNVNDGQWHFVAVTVQRGTPSVFTFYLDGQVNAVTVTANNPTGSISNAFPQLIGRHPLVPYLGFIGQIDRKSRGPARPQSRPNVTCDQPSGRARPERDDRPRLEPCRHNRNSPTCGSNRQ